MGIAMGTVSEILIGDNAVNPITTTSLPVTSVKLSWSGTDAVYPIYVGDSAVDDGRGIELQPQTTITIAAPKHQWFDLSSLFFIASQYPFDGSSPILSISYTAKTGR